MRHIKVYLIAAATAVTLTAAAGYAQNSGQHEHATPPPAQGAAMDHQAMMAMMANMQAEQKKLDDLVAQMNAATGPETVDKIAAVVNEMAAMHKRMSAMMMMHGGQMPAGPPEGGHYR